MKIGVTERGDAALDLSWKIFKGPKILITKDPAKLLKENSKEDFHECLIHCTITGLGGTVVEPNVPPSEVSLEAYQTLCSMFGNQRIVLRVDPLFLGFKEVYERQTEMLFNYGCNGRTRISFLDMYPHAEKRLLDAGIIIPDCYYNKGKRSFHSPLDLRKKAFSEILMRVPHVEVCGEPGLLCTGCVSHLDLKALKINKQVRITSTNRTSCCCVSEKTELLDNKFRCEHGCLYCFWRD